VAVSCNQNLISIYVQHDETGFTIYDLRGSKQLQTKRDLCEGYKRPC